MPATTCSSAAMTLSSSSLVGGRPCGCWIALACAVIANCAAATTSLSVTDALLKPPTIGSAAQPPLKTPSAHDKISSVRFMVNAPGRLPDNRRLAWQTCPRCPCGGDCAGGKPLASLFLAGAPCRLRWGRPALASGKLSGGRRERAGQRPAQRAILTTALQLSFIAQPTVWPAAKTPVLVRYWTKHPQTARSLPLQRGLPTGVERSPHRCREVSPPV